MTAGEAIQQALGSQDLNCTVVHVRRGSAVYDFVAALEQIRKQNPGRQAVKMLVVDDMVGDFAVLMGVGGVEPQAQ